MGLKSFWHYKNGNCKILLKLGLNKAECKFIKQQQKVFDGFRVKDNIQVHKTFCIPSILNETENFWLESKY